VTVCTSDRTNGRTDDIKFFGLAESRNSSQNYFLQDPFIVATSFFLLNLHVWDSQSLFYWETS
jgi:hypothetical protein